MPIVKWYKCWRLWRRKNRISKKFSKTEQLIQACNSSDSELSPIDIPDTDLICLWIRFAFFRTYCYCFVQKRRFVHNPSDSMTKCFEALVRYRIQYAWTIFISMSKAISLRIHLGSYVCARSSFIHEMGFCTFVLICIFVVVFLHFVTLITFVFIQQHLLCRLRYFHCATC